VPGEVDGDRVDAAFDQHRPATSGGDQVRLLRSSEQVLTLPVQGGCRGVHPLGDRGVGVGQPTGGEPDDALIVDQRHNQPVSQGVDHPRVPAGYGDAGVEQLAVGEPRPARVLHEGGRSAAGGGVPELPASPGRGDRGQVDQPPVGQGGDGQRWAVGQQPFPVPAGRLGQHDAQPPDVRGRQIRRGRAGHAPHGRLAPGRRHAVTSSSCPVPAVAAVSVVVSRAGARR